MFYCFLTLLTILVCLFIIYTFVEWKAVKLGKSSTKQLTRPGKPEEWPSVSVLLPVYNEKYVVRQLLEAVSRLSYPANLLEILVLDDSTDASSALIGEMVEKIRTEGVNILHLRRNTRTGYKAGNLNFGLEHARGDFIAIFDADCRPYPQFLLDTIPYFCDKRLGFLQTGMDYYNADRSFMTHFQAMEAAHKDTVTTGLIKDNYMASLTGSACVWRRKCIDAIGGISSATITEDVDMGYAAQLDNWHCAYLATPLASAELPETMAAFRVQRQRWAQGLVHNAIRHARKIFTSKMGLPGKINAASLVFSPLLLALFYILLLLCPGMVLVTPPGNLYFNLLCTIFLLFAIFWGWLNTSHSSSGQTVRSGYLLDFVRYILIYFPLSLYYMSAIVQLALGKGKEFHRTPKGYGAKKSLSPPINKILLTLEIFSFAYALVTLLLAIAYANYWVILYSVLCGCGFGMSLFFSLKDLRTGMLPEHVLITGASGSIGQALAKEYAAPGIRLTLQGRNKEKLSQLAEECARKGAACEIVALNLLDSEKVREWGEQLAATAPPDLLIANAGLNTNIGSDASGEQWQDIKALVEVNLLSTFALVNAILPAMRKKGRGQIAIMSSLAAYYGLPHTPTYCATKSALRNWGMAMRGWLHSEGIRINVILPGYVESDMCRAMPGPKPFLWKPERAAKHIRKGLENDLARISFPFPLNLGIWSLSLLPACLAMPIAKILGYGR